jgi:hypothetical protein
MTKYSRLQHQLNPLHVYASMRHKGVPESIAHWIAITYGRVLFKYIIKKWLYRKDK